MSHWRRADLGDEPEVGAIISAVLYPADTDASVIVYWKKEVVGVLHGVRGVVVYGPSLPTEHRFDLPGRPDDIIGRRAFFWRHYDDGR